jgi:hypothetical protein
MLQKDFAIIAVRLLALYVIVLTAFSLPNYINFAGSNISADPTGRAVLLTGLIGLVLDLILGLGLWFYSPSLANLITKGLSEPPQIKEEFTLDRIQVVAVSLAGLFILSSAIPALFEVIVSYQFPETNPRYVRSISAMGKMKPEIPVVDLVMVGVKLGLGFWFLLGANGIVAVVRGVWAMGNPYHNRG